MDKVGVTITLDADESDFILQTAKSERLKERFPISHIVIASLAEKIKKATDTYGWPAVCPICDAAWKIRSKTMGAAHGQPHQGCCVNNHWWNQSTLEPLSNA